MRIYGWILREGRSKRWYDKMKKSVKRFFLSVLRDVAILCVMILFLLAIGIVTNIAMGITINEYMMAT